MTLRVTREQYDDFSAAVKSEPDRMLSAVVMWAILHFGLDVMRQVHAAMTTEGEGLLVIVGGEA